MTTPKKEIKYLLTLCFLTIIVVVTLKLSFKFLTPMIISFLIALVLNPIVVFAKHKLKIRKSITSSFLIIGILAAFIGITIALGNWMGHEIATFIEFLPEKITELKIFIDSELASLNRMPFMKTNLKLNTIVNNFDFSPYVSIISGKIAEIGGKMPDLFVKFIFMILMTYFFMLNASRIKRWITSKTPQNFMQNFGIKLKQIVGGYFLAQGKLLIIMFVILLVSFIVAKVPYALTLAIITAILDCLPVFGTGTILIPYIMIELICQDYSMALSLFVIYVGTQMFRRFVEPKILGNTIGLDTFLSIISLFVGYQLLGAFGLILGIPVGVIIKYCYDLGVFNKLISNTKIVKDWMFDIIKN